MQNCGAMRHAGPPKQSVSPNLGVDLSIFTWVLGGRPCCASSEREAILRDILQKWKVNRADVLVPMRSSCAEQSGARMSRQEIGFMGKCQWLYTSSTAQGGGGSFKNRKPIGEVGCCESGMAERSHWWIERWLISLTLSLSFALFLWLSTYLPTYRSIYLTIFLSI